MPNFFLKPGEILLTANPRTITTVLGSCVSVTLRDPASGLSAICHAVLPDSQAHPRSRRYPDSYYVDAAVRRMLKEFASRGIGSSRLQISLLGGAAQNGGRFAVGHGNIQSALKVLAEHNLSPNHIDVGGRQGRKVDFDTATGQVASRRLKPTHRSKPCSKS